MPETQKPRDTERRTIAALKGGSEFHAWFGRFQQKFRLPAATLLDVAYVWSFAEPKASMNHHRGDPIYLGVLGSALWSNTRSDSRPISQSKAEYT